MPHPGKPEGIPSKKVPKSMKPSMSTSPQDIRNYHSYHAHHQHHYPGDWNHHRVKDHHHPLHRHDLPQNVNQNHHHHDHHDDYHHHAYQHHHIQGSSDSCTDGWGECWAYKVSKGGTNCYKVVTITILMMMMMMVMMILMMTKSPREALTVTRWSPSWWWPLGTHELLSEPIQPSSYPSSLLLCINVGYRGKCQLMMRTWILNITIPIIIRAWWFELFSKKSSEHFGHQDSPVIYRYEHFLLSVILSTRSP